MITTNISKELDKIINYIITDVNKQWPLRNITSMHFLYAIIKNANTKAHSILYSKLTEKQIEGLEEILLSIISSKRQENGKRNKIDYEYILSGPVIKGAIEFFKKPKLLDSAMILYFICEMDPYVKDVMSNYNIFPVDIMTAMSKTIKPQKKKYRLDNVKKRNVSCCSMNEFDFVTDLLEKAHRKEIPNFIGNNDLYDLVFCRLSQAENQNIAIIGDIGMGKTTFVRHIANKILYDITPFSVCKEDERSFYEIDMYKWVNSEFTSVTVERLINSINQCNKGCVILFLNNVDAMLDITNSLYKVSIEVYQLLYYLLTASNIKLIFSCTEQWYKRYIKESVCLCNKCANIPFNKRADKEILQILEYNKDRNLYSQHFDNDVLLSIIHETNNGNPLSALNLMDEFATYKLYKDTMSIVANENVNMNVTTKTDLQSYLDLKKSVKITKHEFSGDKLKNLNTELKGVIVAQDEAIDAICKVIRRKTLGISDENKPPVLLFAGRTGTGKTYLAKNIAKILYGDENQVVRLDMSEYSDKSTSSKLIGSSAGYIGYENGGILTNAIKKKKQCILLCDEWEKAHEDVYNVFLQVFDEGRLTDNHGEVVSFKDVIIILTSNVGAKEVQEQKKFAGFQDTTQKDKNEINKEIFEKAIKKAFKPELINRIDNILYFNNLDDKALADITCLELHKLEARLEKLGYGFNKNIYQKLPSIILDDIKEQKEYGARSIIRGLKNRVEDKIADLILTHDYPNGHKFKISDFT